MKKIFRVKPISENIYEVGYKYDGGVYGTQHQILSIHSTEIEAQEAVRLAKQDYEKGIERAEKQEQFQKDHPPYEV